MGIVLVCLALAAACNAVMDTLQFRWYDSIFSKYPKIFKEQFWNPTRSWKNKWTTNPKVETWLMVGTEKFWGSSRWFVFLTDGWHMMQWWMITFVGLGFHFATFKFEPTELVWYLAVLISQVVIHATWGLTFSLFFDHLLKKKE